MRKQIRTTRTDADWTQTGMCYEIYLSTTSPDDLSNLPCELYHFMPLTQDDLPVIVNLLDNPVRWFLECQYGGCSCHFRHLNDVGEMYFAPPEDWYPEDEDNIVATSAVYDVLVGILTDGHKVDLIDAWSNTSLEAITALDVSLSEVDRDSFRFFENRKFHLSR